MRCSECEKNFCSNSDCMEEPYHEFKTCKQFKDDKEAMKCRFCQENMAQPSLSPLPAFTFVCREKECVELMSKNCDKMLACGHACCGFKGEERCLPCLDPECVNKNGDATRGKIGDDYCTICFTEGYNQKPCVQIGCGHIFHLACMIEKLKLRWPGCSRIRFEFL